MSPKPKTNKEIDLELKEKFGDEFKRMDDYINSGTTITFYHKNCGNYFKTRVNKLAKGKCPKCCSKKQRTYEDLIKEIENLYGDRYLLLSTKEELSSKRGKEYVNLSLKAKFKCNKCKKIFYQKPLRLINENLGCTYCISNRKKTFNEAKKEIFEISNGNLELISNYKNRREKVTVRCIKCGEITEDYYFNFTTNKRLCSCCSLSKGERLIYFRLKELKLDNIHNYQIDECRHINPLRFDFYVNNDILIEFDGEQHFENIDFLSSLPFITDKIKNKYCIDNNLTLLRISYKNIRKINDIINGSTTIKHFKKFDNILLIKNGKVIIRKGIYNKIDIF